MVFLVTSRGLSHTLFMAFLVVVSKLAPVVLSDLNSVVSPCLLLCIKHTLDAKASLRPSAGRL